MKTIICKNYVLSSKVDINHRHQIIYITPVIKDHHKCPWAMTTQNSPCHGLPECNINITNFQEFLRRISHKTKKLDTICTNLPSREVPPKQWVEWKKIFVTKFRLTNLHLIHQSHSNTWIISVHWKILSAHWKVQKQLFELLMDVMLAYMNLNVTT